MEKALHLSGARVDFQKDEVQIEIDRATIFKIMKFVDSNGNNTDELLDDDGTTVIATPLEISKAPQETMGPDTLSVRILEQLESCLLRANLPLSQSALPAYEKWMAWVRDDAAGAQFLNFFGPLQDRDAQTVDVLLSSLRKDILYARQIQTFRDGGGVSACFVTYFKHLKCQNASWNSVPTAVYMKVPVGTAVAKDFEENGVVATYKGVVQAFDAEKSLYRVVYDDGDAEDLEWVDLKPHLGPTAGRSRPGDIMAAENIHTKPASATTTSNSPPPVGTYPPPTQAREGVRVEFVIQCADKSIAIHVTEEEAALIKTAFPRTELISSATLLQLVPKMQVLGKKSRDKVSLHSSIHHSLFLAFFFLLSFFLHSSIHHIFFTCSFSPAFFFSSFLFFFLSLVLSFVGPSVLLSFLNPVLSFFLLSLSLPVFLPRKHPPLPLQGIYFFLPHSPPSSRPTRTWRMRPVTTVARSRVLNLSQIKRKRTPQLAVGKFRIERARPRLQCRDTAAPPHFRPNRAWLAKCLVVSTSSTLLLIRIPRTPTSLRMNLQRGASGVVCFRCS
jgi:hypothetical protein